MLLLAQYERTAAAVYEAEESVEMLVELLQIYREKGADIFANTCMLLGIMGFDNDRRQVSSFHPHIEAFGHHYPLFVCCESLVLLVDMWTVNNLVCLSGDECGIY